MSDDSTALVVQEPALPSARVIRPGTPVAAFVPATFAEAQKMAMVIAASNMAPKSYNNDPARILVGMMTGAEVGLTPMQSLRGVAVIGNQPSLWGDVALAVVLSSGLVEDMAETQEGDFADPNKGDGVAICTIKRKGRPTPVTVEFGMADARGAGLMSKSGPWQTARQRMCQFRARNFALRDLFPDVLSGLHVANPDEDDSTANLSARRAAPETRQATVDDLHAQSEGRVHGETIDATTNTVDKTGENSAAVAAAAPQPKTEAEPIRRRRVRTPKAETATDGQQDGNAGSTAADSAPKRRQPTDEDHANISMWKGLLADYREGLEMAERGGDRDAIEQGNVNVSNITAAIEKLESEVDFGGDGVPIVGNGYDLNAGDQSRADDSDGLDLEGHLTLMRAKELLPDVMAYQATGLIASDAMIFESERAKLVARRKAEARQR